MTPFRFVYGMEAKNIPDATLPNVTDEVKGCVATYLQHAEEARLLARLRIKDQRSTDATGYNLRRRQTEYKPGDCLGVWMPIRRRGLSETFLHIYPGPYKIARQIGELDY